MSTRDPDCKCENVKLDDDDGRRKCMICNQPYQEVNYFILFNSSDRIFKEKGAELGKTKLGTKRTDNVRPKYGY
jgi:hypothetical protein